MEEKEKYPDEKAETSPAATELPAEPQQKENKERYLAENEIFRRYFTALQTDLDSLNKKYGKEPDSPDAVKALSGEVATLKNSVEQIRSYLEQLAANSGQRQIAPQSSWYQPPVFSPGSGNVLPYIQTPNIQPIMPQPINNTGRF